MRILVVDDESLERKGIRHLINKFGFELDIVEANNGSTAMDCLRRQQVDILFTDLKMPFVDGLELSRYAREIFPHIKIIFYSAYSEFEYAQQAIEIGVVNYMVKPIVLTDFQKIMQRIIGECNNEKERNKLNESLIHELNTDNYSESAISSDVVDEIKKIVKHKYMEDLNLDDIAARINLSPGYVSHVFKNGTGKTFIKYLNEYRLKKAVYLLTHTHMKVNQIGEIVGFANPPYFCTIFKKEFGCTPRDFRISRTS